MTKLLIRKLLLLGLTLLPSCGVLWQGIDDIRDVPHERGMTTRFPYTLDDVLPVVRDELINAKTVIQEDEELAPGRHVLYFRTTFMKFDADPGVVGRAFVERQDEGSRFVLYTEPLSPGAMPGRGTGSYFDQIVQAVHGALRPKVIEGRFEELRQKRAGTAADEAQGGGR